ncbi:hypothetical protein Tco_0963440 [Tanacetum coccineum]
MGDANLIRTLGDYSRPGHEGYKNTIELPVRNNVIPLRSDTIREDDYDRGCRKPSDLEDGFYKDTIKLGPEYVTGMDDEGEVTKILIKNEEEIFTVRGDNVGIKPDGVASPAKPMIISSLSSYLYCFHRINPKVSLYISYPVDITLGVVVYVFDLQVKLDKKLGSS